MEGSSALLVLAFIAAVAFIARIINRKPHRKLKHPPGPKPWPIIGNLNLIIGSSRPHRSLHALSQKYGELSMLKFGNIPVVIAASPEMAKLFLKTYDTVFASRPAQSGGRYTTFDFSDVTWAPYGQYWIGAQIFLTEVLNPKALKLYEHVRVEEKRTFLSRVHSLSLSGKPVVLREEVYRYSLSTMSKTIFGRLCFQSHESDGGNTLTLDQVKALLDECFVMGGALNIGDYIPWLNFLDLQGLLKQMKALYNKLDRFYSDMIDYHLTHRELSVSINALDSLLRKVRIPPEVKLTRENVKGMLQGLLAGGTDTSVIAIEWSIHEIMRHPRVYDKAKEELERVIGKSRWVEEEDFSQLPYLEAIIKESMRLHPIAALLAPHLAMEDCNVAGYDISKGTVVMINNWSLGRDPKAWDKPEEFMPERFMVEEIDMLGSNFALLPFGSGRRMCPGYRLALNIVRSTLANLLHGYNWRLPDGMTPEEVCLEEEYGFTIHPKIPVAMIIEPSLPAHLY
uniref:CYP92A45 n=1 Tax=Scoparia dulcis TaxID=107240 RepID=D4P919_SCODU|nr:CYP92A45 [Scoparia dulcis]